MRVLLTGHTGFVGAVMTEVLGEAGHDVVGLDTGLYDGCDLFPLQQNVPTIKRDVREITEQDVEGFDAVIHLAGLSNDPLGHVNPNLTYDINLEATVRLARMARDAGVGRFIFASSCSLYGAGDSDAPLDETAPTAPLTPYAKSKIESEIELTKLANEHFSPVFMRNATCYGVSARMRADVVLNNLVCWAVLTGKIRLNSDGGAWRPLLHIEDMSRAFAAVLIAPREKIHNQAFNIGRNDQNYKIREVAEIVRQTVPDCEVEFADEASPDARSYRVDFSKLANAFPELDFRWDAEKGARQVYDAVRESGMTKAIFMGRRHIRLNQLKHLMGSGQIDHTLRWV